MAKQLSRPKRWAAAVEKATKALSDLETHLASVEEAGAELEEVRQEYENWKDNLPENLQSGNLADKLEEVVSLDFNTEIEGLRSSFDSAQEVISTAEGIDLPQGFGRD